MDEEISYEEKERVRLGHKNPIWKRTFIIILEVAAVDLLATLASSDLYKHFSKAGLGKVFKRIHDLVPENVKTIMLLILIALLLVDVLMYIFVLRPPSFDYWVRSIAHKRLSCEYIYYDRKYIYFEYDVGLKNKDIKDFFEEITDKSQHYSYFIEDIDIDLNVIKAIVKTKQPIPTRCSIEKEKDVLWNFIPMGEAINKTTMKVSEIGWYLNDNNINENAILSLPSTSMLIAGGTGSGKSVVENGIIGHLTRHSDRIQGLLIDVKKVEFGGLESYEGIHKVGLTINEAEEILAQARQIMMDRFTFMEHNGVNNIYKLEGNIEVDNFVIHTENGDRQFQFDEIFPCNVNGEQKLWTLDKIYEAVKAGDEVEIDDKFLK